MTILTLNGAYFVEGEKAFKETLFKPLAGKTANGWYKRLKGRVVFHKPDGEVFAAFVSNDKFTGLVTAQKVDNKVRFMNGLCSLDGEQFGLDVNDYRIKKSFEQSLKPFVK